MRKKQEEVKKTQKNQRKNRERERERIKVTSIINDYYMFFMLKLSHRGQIGMSILKRKKKKFNILGTKSRGIHLSRKKYIYIKRLIPKITKLHFYSVDNFILLVEIDAISAVFANETFSLKCDPNRLAQPN